MIFSMCCVKNATSFATACLLFCFVVFHLPSLASAQNEREKIVIIEQTQEDLEMLAMEARRLELEKQREHSLPSPTMVARAIQKLIDTPDLADHLGVTSPQMEKLSTSLGEYQAGIKQAKPENIDSMDNDSRKLLHQQVSSIRKLFVEDVKEVLMPFQLSQISKMTPSRSGVFALILSEDISKYLGITKDQRREIASECEKESKEIERLINEQRRRSEQILTSSLTDEQKKKLKELTKHSTKDYFENLSMASLKAIFDMAPPSKSIGDE